MHSGLISRLPLIGYEQDMNKTGKLNSVPPPKLPDRHTRRRGSFNAKRTGALSAHSPRYYSLGNNRVSTTTTTTTTTTVDDKKMQTPSIGQATTVMATGDTRQPSQKHPPLSLVKWCTCRHRILPVTVAQTATTTTPVAGRTICSTLSLPQIHAESDRTMSSPSTVPPVTLLRRLQRENMCSTTTAVKDIITDTKQPADHRLRVPPSTLSTEKASTNNQHGTSFTIQSSSSLPSSLPPPPSSPPSSPPSPPSPPTSLPPSNSLWSSSLILSSSMASFVASFFQLDALTRDIPDTSNGLGSTDRSNLTADAKRDAQLAWRWAASGNTTIAAPIISGRLDRSIQSGLTPSTCASAGNRSVLKPTKTVAVFNNRHHTSTRWMSPQARLAAARNAMTETCGANAAKRVCTIYAIVDAQCQDGATTNTLCKNDTHNLSQTDSEVSHLWADCCPSDDAVPYVSSRSRLRPLRPNSQHYLMTAVEMYMILRRKIVHQLKPRAILNRRTDRFTPNSASPLRRSFTAKDISDG